MILRLPHGKDLIWKRSHCPQCAKALSWYHNIPVLSFIVLRARCAFCANKIPWRYPAIELFTGFILLWHWKTSASSSDLFLGVYFLSSLIAASVIDLDHWLLPDKITLPGIAVGLLSNAIFSYVHGDSIWIDSILGVLFGGSSLYLISWLYEKVTGNPEGIGGGDLKYLAMIGAFLGLKGTIMTLILSSVTGSILGILVIMAQRGSLKARIPFGPFLSLGAVLSYKFGNVLWQWYFLR